MDAGVLYVTRTLLQDSKKGGFYFGSPKTKNSKRKNSLTDEVKRVLQDQQRV